MDFDLLDRAVADALCPMFQGLSTAGTAITVFGPAFGPKGFAVASVAAPITTLSMLGASATCAETEIGQGQEGCAGIDGCRLVEGGSGQLQSQVPPGVLWYPQGINDCFEILTVSEPYFRNSRWNRDLYIRTITTPSPFLKTIAFQTEEEAIGSKFRINVSSGTCADSCSSNPAPNIPDHTYTDPTTNCNYNVKFEGFIRETPDGPIQPVFEISGTQESRASGGRIGGCVLAPTIHVGGPNGPGGPGGPRIPPIPVPPDPPGPDDDGIPWWAKPLLAGATSAILSALLDALGDALGGGVGEAKYTMIAPCDYDENGDNLKREWPLPAQKKQDRMLANQEVMLEALQQHLSWKTPICGNEKPKPEGQWVTTRWESVEKMDHSGRRLRKLFRYRTKSSRDLGQLSAYWANFTWQSGSVCVIHKGAWWGTPQVWAASEAEGKRVIRHAAAEAGIDPDKTGEWSTGSSRSPRYGMPGTMKAKVYEGFPWIASREGPEWPNILALQRDP